MRDTVCENEGNDINAFGADSNTTGDGNTCDTTSDYDDTGTTGCTYSCGAHPPKGDLNRDYEVTQTDAVISLRMAVNGGWSEDADVSGDDQVTSLDALLILQAAASHIEL
jgi:hypothetical protein